MNSYAINKEHDLFLKNGQIARNADGDEVVQHVKTRLLFFLEEWFLDSSAGLPYFQEFFTKPANISNLESRIKSEIITTDGLQELLSFDLDFNNVTRKVRVNFKAVTTYGTLSDEVSINV